MPPSPVAKTWLRSLTSAIRGLSPSWALVGLASLFLLLHGRGFTQGPNGFHVWREADTATVAENYLRSGMDFFHPEINLIGRAGDRVVGMELPVYNYAVAVLYRIFGFSHAWPRLLSALSGLSCVWAMYRLMAIFCPRKGLGLLAAWLTSWSPLLYFYSHKIQPDVMGLALSLWGLVWFLEWQRQGRSALMLRSWLALGVAGGIKPTFLAVGLPMLWFLMMFQTKNILKNLRRWDLWIFGLGVLLIPSLWLHHARRLTERFGEAYFYLGGDLWTELHGLFHLKFYENVMMTWPIELAWGLPAFVSVLYLMVSTTARARVKPMAGLCGAWGLGALVVLVLAAGHCATAHDYYFLVALPPLIILAALAFEAMLLDRKARWVALSVLLVMPLHAYLRMGRRFGEAPDLISTRKIVADALQKNGLSTTSKALTVDPVPGYFFYYTGLTGYQMVPDSPVEFLNTYRREGAQVVVFNPRYFEGMSWLEVALGPSLLHDSNLAIHRLM